MADGGWGGGQGVESKSTDMEEPFPPCTCHAMGELNRQAASDEKARAGEGALRDPGMPWRRVFYPQ